jgi:hypothetical protein
MAVIEIGPRHFTQAAPSVCKPVSWPVKWMRQPDAEFLWFLPHRGNSPGCFSFAAGVRCPGLSVSDTDSSGPCTAKDLSLQNRLNPSNSRGDDCQRPRRIGTSEVVETGDPPLSNGCRFMLDACRHARSNLVGLG